MTTPDPECARAFSDWLMNTPIGDTDQIYDVAHEAFCSGWEAGAEARSAAILQLAENDPGLTDEALRDQGATTERQAIIQLAVAKNAVCGGRPSDPDLLRSFAAVLHETRDQPQPTTTQEPT